MTDPAPTGRPDVELRLPADGAFAAVLRTTTAGLAARLDFTIEDIEDLRMAVGEASALVLEHARSEGELLSRFWLAPGHLVVELSAPTSEPEPVDEESFAWQVLTTLATAANAELDAERIRITVTMRPEATV